jgi:hypothetical protein
MNVFVMKAMDTKITDQANVYTSSHVITDAVTQNALKLALGSMTINAIAILDIFWNILRMKV